MAVREESRVDAEQPKTHSSSSQRERDNVVYWKTKRKINDDLQWLFTPL